MIHVEPTPNPNAVKFTVGRPVGGPATFLPGQETDNELARQLLDLQGVTSIFLTADFITISKSADASWDEIVSQATEIMADHFG